MRGGYSSAVRMIDKHVTKENAVNRIEGEYGGLNKNFNVGMNNKENGVSDSSASKEEQPPRREGRLS